MAGRARLPVRRGLPREAALDGRHAPAPPEDTPKVVVVMPAYNAGRTLEATYAGWRRTSSTRSSWSTTARTDATVDIARASSGSKIFVHDQNHGYGGNQKTCYTEALRAAPTSW